MNHATHRKATILASALLLTLSLGVRAAEPAPPATGAPATGAATSGSKAGNMIDQSVVKIPIKEGVSMDEAVESMKLRANLLNMKLVAEMPLSQQVQVTTGKEQRRMEIFQFCDPLTAKEMVDYNLNFAAYLPCRIALVEDEKGKGWLVMMAMDPLIEGAGLNTKLREKAVKVRDTLNDIMQAGANGDI